MVQVNSNCNQLANAVYSQNYNTYQAYYPAAVPAGDIMQNESLVVERNVQNLNNESESVRNLNNSSFFPNNGSQSVEIMNNASQSVRNFNNSSSFPNHGSLSIETMNNSLPDVANYETNLSELVARGRGRGRGRASGCRTETQNS